MFLTLYYISISVPILYIIRWQLLSFPKIAKLFLIYAEYINCNNYINQRFSQFREQNY